MDWQGRPFAHKLTRRKTNRPYRRILRPEGTDSGLLRPGKRAKLLSPENLGAALTCQCCDRKCCSRFTLAEVEEARLVNLRKSEGELLEWTAARLSACMVGDPHNVKRSVFKYNIDMNRPVCRTAWRLFFGISDWKLRAARLMAVCGQTVVVRQLATNERPVYAFATVLIGKFLERECDPVVGGVQVLPAFITPRDIREEVYMQWLSEPQVATLQPPGIGLIRKILRQEFKTLHTPRKGDWGFCSICAVFDANRRKSGLSLTERSVHFDQQRAHRNKHRSARAALEQRAREARQDPSVKEVSLHDITRSAFFPNIRPDNSVRLKRSLSRVTALVQTSRTAEKAELHVGGLLSYGTGLRYLLGWFANCSIKGGNLICTWLFFYLYSLKRSTLPAAQARELHVQVDGGSENINQYVQFHSRLFIRRYTADSTVFGFLAVLVAKGWFRTVYVHRLVVGHTHNAIGERTGFP